MASCTRPQMPPFQPILCLRLAVSLAVAAQDSRPSGSHRDLLRSVKSIFVFPLPQGGPLGSGPPLMSEIQIAAVQTITLTAPRLAG